MFDAIRTHKKLLVWLVFVPVSIAFAILGMGGYGSGESAADVAKVDGHAITQIDWDNAHHEDVERLRRENPSLELNALDSPLVKYGSLQRLVRDRVLATTAQKEHLGVSDAMLAAALQQDPSIAALRDADGHLDMEGYKKMLASYGLTPQGYEAQLRQDLSMQQVLGGVSQTVLASDATSQLATKAFLEEREIRVANFKPKNYAAALKPTEAELQSQYKEHLAQYNVAETVDIEYAVLDLDGIKKNIAVSEQELRDYYKQNAASLGEPEERRASHIMIAAASDAPQAERDAAHEQAEKILTEVRAAPGRFAEIAKASSADDISAAEGGDLGFFQAERGTDPTLATAAFQLDKVGDVSDLVSSDFGWHIVELTDIKPAQVPPFEDVRAKLEEEFRNQKAQQQYSELAERFTNGVYEQADSLKPVADAMDLTVHTATNVLRDPNPEQTGPLANPRFLSALFSADSLEHKRNTEAIEVGSNELVSGRVIEHTAAHAKPFADVEDQVRKAWIAEHSADAAKKAGEAKYKAWEDKPESATDLSAPMTISREDLAGQPPALIEAAFRANPEKLPTVVGVDLGSDGYAIARIEKVLPTKALDKEESALYRDRYDDLWSQAETMSYYNWLQSHYKTKIMVPMPSATDPDGE